MQENWKFKSSFKSAKISGSHWVHTGARLGVVEGKLEGVPIGANDGEIVSRCLMKHSPSPSDPRLGSTSALPVVDHSRSLEAKSTTANSKPYTTQYLSIV